MLITTSTRLAIAMSLTQTQIDVRVIAATNQNRKYARCHLEYCFSSHFVSPSTLGVWHYLAIEVQRRMLFLLFQNSSSAMHKQISSRSRIVVQISRSGQCKPNFMAIPQSWSLPCQQFKPAIGQSVPPRPDRPVWSPHPTLPPSLAVEVLAASLRREQHWLRLRR